MSENERKPTTSSRLGKEAKVGVLVIASLLVILGIVVTIRVMRSTSSDNSALVADRESAKERPTYESKTNSLLKDTKSKLFGSSNPPTVVPANAASTRPAKSVASDLDKWKLASDRGEPKRTGSGGPALGATPPLMPDPPKPPHAGRHERYALDPPADKAMDDVKPLQEAGNDMRLLAPRDEKSAHSGMRGSGRADSGGYASADSPPALPSHRERSRFETPATLQSPAPLRPDASYSMEERSTPTIPVAQYDGDDYRRQPTTSRRSGNEFRRSATAMSYSAPPRRDDGKYEVQPNDSYWTISERLYGTGAYFKALAQHNQGKGASEDRLQPGTLILAPDVAQLEKSYPDLCPKASRREAMQSQSQSRTSTVSTRNQYRSGRTYTVVEGDTLFNIARYELGKASRWAEIYDLNRDVLGKDFNYLTPGTQLTLPDGEKSDTLAQPPSNTYRR
jgi:nucleoid-associated protein YgaU